MKKNELMIAASSYLKRNVFKFILILIFGAIFAIVLFLYNMPAEPVIYAFLICMYSGLIYTCTDFIKYVKHHKQLKNLQKSITVNFDTLPAPRDIIEEDYHTLIQLLHDDKVRMISRADNVRSDMVDYFTLWAHQIKTPIAAMNLLLQTDDSEQNHELSMELFKIEQYVEMVLQYLRFENMNSDLVLKKHNLDDLVKQAVRKYAKLFIRNKIQLSYANLNSNVLTDEKWLVFVIEQILSNALKYTNKGTISIYMDPSSDKTLVIEDTGIGIKAEDLPRVFEKGYTGYNGRIDKKSTGIGLYLCKQILTKLSHKISIESKIGCGTKVFIDLAVDEISFE